MRIAQLILAVVLSGMFVGCDEGGSGSAGPGVNTNNSGASTGGAAVKPAQDTNRQGSAQKPNGGSAGSDAGTHGKINAAGGQQ